MSMVDPRELINTEAQSPRVPSEKVDIGALFAEVTTSLQRDDLSSAEAQLRTVLSSDPSFAPAHALMAFIRVRQGNPLEAVERAELAVSLDPESADVRNVVGSVYFAVGRPLEAEQAFRASNDLRPHHPETLWNLAQLAYARGLYDEAIEWFRETLKLDPSNAEVLNALADCYNRVINQGSVPGA